MKILNKDPGHDPVQTKIDIVQSTIRVYESYLDWYDDKYLPKTYAELLRKLEKEVKNLEVLKSKHPEYFI